jgi:hypothetical protein
MLSCCGTGCILKDWSQIESKTRKLMLDDALSRQLGQLGLKLNYFAYVEHSDCAERKFYNDYEPLISNHRIVVWPSNLRAWFAARQPHVYQESHALQKRLM